MTQTLIHPAHEDALLDAGAVLDGPGPAHPSVAPVTGRAYAHPALPGRTVVRLVSEPVGAAEDLTMEFLGFATVDAVPVGHGRVRTPGFPASALVQDPAHGAQALALVKEMEKLARLARSKPGNARDGYLAVARRLAETVPRFLPPFWEQAGRAFTEAENPRQAAICFADARRAEQVHGLPVDEDRLRATHLEFALAGALTAKAFTDYARDVAARLPAGQAYPLIRSVAMQRVAGGLAPGAGFAADLRRAAKAAGLDAAAADDADAAELVRLPAVVRAHPSFWKSYRKPLLRLARRDPAVATRLRELLPEPPGWGTDLTEEWLGLIVDAGVLDDPAADVAAWLERFAGYRSRHRLAAGTVSPQLLDLVPRLAPRLRAAGRPLALHPADARVADLNLMDACLAHGVPVAAWSDPAGLPVERWYDMEAEGRRDLAAVAADPGLLPALARGLWRMLDRYTQLDPAGYNAVKLVTVLAATPGLAAALRHGIGQVRLAGATVAGLEAALRELHPLWSTAGVALAVAELRRIAALDAAEVLAGSLRAGLVDELGWPAYEEAVAELKRLGLSPSWPTVTVSDQNRVVTVAPDGARAEHTVRIPAGSWHTDVTGFVLDGRLLVAGRSPYPSAGWAYWADRPDRTFELPRAAPVPAGPPLPYLPLAGGGVTGGGAPWLPGDAVPAEPGLVSSDGVTHWHLVDGRWREFDPVTGTPGPDGVPGFFSDGVPPGRRLLPEWSWLRPGPAEFADSPLGAADGLLGWCVHELPDGTQVGRAIDGRTVLRRPTAPDEVLVGALRLPGDHLLRPVTARTGGQTRPHDLAVTVWSPDGASPLQECLATHSRPPFPYWHALRPRDPAGSAALRAVTAPVAAALLADVAAGNAGLDHLTDQAIARHLPAVTDRNLLRALRSVVRTAARLHTRLQRLRELLAPHADPAATQTAGDVAMSVGTPASGPEPAAASRLEKTAAVSRSDTAPAAGPETAPVTDGELTTALEPLTLWRGRYYSGSVRQRTAIMDQLAALTGAFAQPPRALPMPDAESAWPRLLPGLGAVLMVAASPATSPERRSALSRLLRAFADSPFAAADPRFRFVQLLVTAEHGAAEAGGDGRRIVFLSGGGHRMPAREPRFLRYAVDFCAEAAFAPIDGIEVRTDLRRGGWGDAARLRTAAELLDAEGAAPWHEEAVRRLAERTGLTRAEAALLLGGLPIAGWDERALTAPQRKALGLTAAEAGLAGAAWHGIAHEHRVVLLDAAVPDDPADLWRHGPDPDAPGELWLDRLGRRTPIAEELLAEAKRVIPGGMGQEMLRLIVEPKPRTWLCTDGVTDTDDWDLTTVSAYGDAFDEGWLKAVAVALPWLAYRLPAGDPLRDRLPRALELVRQRLDNPDLVVGSAFFPEGLAPDGLPGLLRTEGYPGYVRHHLRPAAITTPDDPVLLLGDVGVAAALRLLRDPALPDVIAEADALPGGAWPHDPRHSAPGLVAEVAAAYGLAPDAAAYHLLLLALPDPTDANASRWLGLAPARLKPLRAALVAAGLVVEARRERAGRAVFLPGGWLSLKAPALPLESWKAPLFGLTPGSPPPLGTVPVGRPVASLFQAAWSRITAGDTPGGHRTDRR
ncbi:hypothetical protein CS0771_03240 [Catellatospora sp. IY07-71]|uniref:hypothetical protein n=1 Tax=Catellatospora sp. IY07-71 TaxID=2728827 RepID=UPI001BB3CE4C|nr:hypothetical protein [Catellatospora sp. IY07-71]BCJ70780.1 hypothetical protein CS0771_03240 [Catellatospora sp. IY07-71]